MLARPFLILELSKAVDVVIKGLRIQVDLTRIQSTREPEAESDPRKKYGSGSYPKRRIPSKKMHPRVQPGSGTGPLLSSDPDSTKTSATLPARTILFQYSHPTLMLSLPLQLMPTHYSFFPISRFFAIFYNFMFAISTRIQLVTNSKYHVTH